MESKKTGDITSIVGYVAIIVIVISLAFIGFRITGLATTDTATINVTITNFTAINFTTDFVNLGSGSVNAGESGATINTEGSVTGGSWTPVSTPLVLENIGNTNATIDIISSKNAATFIGGDTPTFKIKVGDTSGNTGACQSNGAATYTEIGTNNITICNPLQFDSDVDEIDIDVELYIPSDATGSKTTTLTAYATAA
ncbi:MAG: hypothetical protein WC494_01750 [Candidatus Pacearchaeota archaeon]